MTQDVLDRLRAQCLDEPLKLIVIDDGSTDGTFEFLSTQEDVTRLHGNGSLWWGGAINLGLQLVLREARPEDWVLLVNNDARFNPDFIQRLLDTARSYAPAAVGSVICDESSPEDLLSIGVVFDTWNLLTRDKLERRRQRDTAKGPHPVDALSGRGTLYPLQAVRSAGGMKAKWLPHYFADYELAVRVGKAGYQLLVSEQAAVFSANEFGTDCRPASLSNKLFAVRSASYLPAVLAFWWSVSSPAERLSLFPRLVRRLVYAKSNRSADFRGSSQ